MLKFKEFRRDTANNNDNNDNINFSFDDGDDDDDVDADDLLRKCRKCDNLRRQPIPKPRP